MSARTSTSNLMSSTVRRIFTKPPGYVIATAVISIGSFLNGYDTGCIGAITEMPFFTETFGELSPTLRGITVSLVMLGGVVPGFFAGQLADYYGRLATICTGAIIFLVGAIFQGAAYQLPMFMVGRLLCGIGEGTWMSSVQVYVAEIAPSARRGMLASMPAFDACLGVCVGYFSCYASIHVDSSLSFRAPYIVQAGFALILAASCFVLPESPRWLLHNGQREKAINELKRLDFSAVEAEKDLLGPAAQQQQRAPRPGPIEGLLMIFRQQYRRRTVLALFVLGMVQLCGIDGVLYYAPTLFAQAGIPAASSSFLASGLSAILMLAISIPAMLLGDRIPRRASALIGGTVLGSCMLLIGALYASDSVHATGPARWVVIVLVFVFSLAYCATWGVVGKIYASEIQPAVTRSSANSVAQGLGFFTNWLVAVTTPVLLAQSRFGAYFLFAGFCVLTVVVLAANMPETKGKSLEDIAEAFAQPVGGGWRLVEWVKRLGVRTARAVGIEMNDFGSSGSTSASQASASRRSSGETSQPVGGDTAETVTPVVRLEAA